eukprot:Skav217185  [mRNA]  locus=scaffold557:16283:18744:+ [translate_table: standard]
MSTPGPSGTEHSVTVRLGDLELTITARRVQPAGSSSDDGGFELVSATAAEVVERPASTPSPEAFAGEVTFALQERVLAATTIPQLENLGIPFLTFFADRLRPVHQTWTPRARIARAFRAGIAAQRRLSGAFCDSTALPLPLKNSVYICLRGGGGVLGWRLPTMANPSMRPLTRAAVEDLYLRSAHQDALPVIHLPLVPPPEPGATIGLCYVTMLRENGFMLTIAASDEMRNAILAFPVATDGSGPEFSAATVTIESNRKRALGRGQVDLVDLPWEAITHFCAVRARWVWARVQRSHCHHRVKQKTRSWQRASGLGRPAVGSHNSFLCCSSYSRVRRQSASIGSGHRELQCRAARENQYTGSRSSMDQFHGSQHCTGVPHRRGDGARRVRGRCRRSRGWGGSGPSGETVARQDRRAPEPAAGTVASASSSGCQLLHCPPSQSPASLCQWAWGDSERCGHRLRTMAGPPPPRVGQSVQARQAPARAAPPLVDNIYAEIERGALEAGEPEVTTGAWDLMQAQLEEVQDPMHRFMMMQLQQNQVLLDRLVSSQPKEKDPVLSALAGGGQDNASVGASTGVKGCMARDAFLKAVLDLPKVASLSRVNALRELGIPAAKEDSSLMRKYVERKMALADHRVLGQVATMLAESWAVAYESNNEQMMGALSRMLYYVEQAALDNGRTQLAYLLSGFQEPAYHLFVNSRKRASIQPFAGLCSAAWVSGNLAYLKDLDYMESRMTSLNKQPKAADPDPERPNPKPKKPPKKPKGEGKGKAAASSGVAEADQ